MIFRSSSYSFCLIHVAFGETNSSNVTNITKNGTGITTTVAADGFDTTTTAVATTTEAPTTTERSTTSDQPAQFRQRLKTHLFIT